jgi:hypothetical protein
MKKAAEGENPDGTPATRWTEVIFGYPGRLTAYGLLTVLVCQLALVAIRENGIGFIAHEGGLIEQSQFWLALFAAGSLFYAGSRIRIGGTALTLCACLVAYAAAKESDWWFETTFFDDAYKYFAGIPLLTAGLVVLYRGRKRIVNEWMMLTATPCVTMFAIAGIYFCSICQVFDRPDLLTSLGDPASADMTKAAIEEFAELFGYLLLGFSGVESIVMAFATSPVTADATQPVRRSAEQCIDPQPAIAPELGSC